MAVNARNPEYNAHGTIDLEVETDRFGWVPFTATPDDVEEVGRDLHARALAGEFGEIAAYVPPPPPEPPTQAELDAIADALADAVLRQNKDAMRAMGETLAEVVFRVSNGTVPQNVTEAQARTWVRDTFRAKYRALL